VKSLIELHGGEIELRSAPGAGTRVVCRLPDTAHESAAPAAAGARVARRFEG
jgi:signal transduction histidine kinase